MEQLKILKGFHNSDGTLDEFLDWGFEIGFTHNDIKFNIDHDDDDRTILIRLAQGGEPKRIVFTARNTKEFLEGTFEGMTIREMIADSFVTNLH